MQRYNDLSVNVFESVFVGSNGVIRNHLEAAKHILYVGMDNALGDFIENALINSRSFKAFRQSMPPKTPKPISNYQKNFPIYNISSVDQEINKCGITLVEGTCLFHGGCWVNDSQDSIKTDRPFSTSFCPQVALRNAEYGGKAYSSGEVHLFVLNVLNPVTKVFVFKNKGTKLGHEHEVLFASGANLALRNKTKIRDNYKVSRVTNGYQILEKEVPAYVLEIDIS